MCRCCFRDWRGLFYAGKSEGIIVVTQLTTSFELFRSVWLVIKCKLRWKKGRNPLLTMWMMTFVTTRAELKKHGHKMNQAEPVKLSDTRKHLYSIFYYFMLQFCLTVNKLIHITTPQDHGTGIPVLYYYYYYYYFYEPFLWFQETLKSQRKKLVFNSWNISVRAHS